MVVAASSARGPMMHRPSSTYFYVVFMLPYALREVVRYNLTALFTMLFHACVRRVKGAECGGAASPRTARQRRMKAKLVLRGTLDYQSTVHRARTATWGSDESGVRASYGPGTPIAAGLLRETYAGLVSRDYGDALTLGPNNAALGQMEEILARRAAPQ